MIESEEWSKGGHVCGGPITNKSIQNGFSMLFMTLNSIFKGRK
jgi:hypothetical protein